MHAGPTHIVCAQGPVVTHQHQLRNLIEDAAVQQTLHKGTAVRQPEAVAALQPEYEGTSGVDVSSADVSCAAQCTTLAVLYTLFDTDIRQG